MNFFEVASLLVCAVIGAIVFAVTMALGLTPGLATLLGICCAVFLVLVQIALVRWWLRIQPLWPTCRNGKCRAPEYEMVERGAGMSFVRCQCGDIYQHSRDAKSDTRRFKLVTANGTTVPYLKARGWRAWEPENETENQV